MAYERRDFLFDTLKVLGGGVVGGFTGRLTAPNKVQTTQQTGENAAQTVAELNQKVVDLSVENGKLSGEIAVYEKILQDHGVSIEKSSDEQEKLRLAVELFTIFQGLGFPYQGNGVFQSNDGKIFHIDAISRDECKEGFPIERAHIELKSDVCGATPTVTPTQTSTQAEIATETSLPPTATATAQPPTLTQLPATRVPPTEVPATPTLIPAPTNTEVLPTSGPSSPGSGKSSVTQIP